MLFFVKVLQRLGVVMNSDDVGRGVAHIRMLHEGEVRKAQLGGYCFQKCSQFWNRICAAHVLNKRLNSFELNAHFSPHDHVGRSKSPTPRAVLNGHILGSQAKMSPLILSKLCQETRLLANPESGGMGANA